MDFISCSTQKKNITLNRIDNTNLLYLIISTSFHISFNGIQHAHLNKMIK